jgi:hypothetical protein
MTKLSELFPSKFLKADDLDSERVVVLDRVERETVGRDKELKGVCYFRGEPKGLVLNSTNARAIAAITQSEDCDDWPGTQVLLFVAAVDFQGRLVNSIRVRPVPKAKKSVAPSSTDEDSPAIANNDGIPF